MSVNEENPLASFVSGMRITLLVYRAAYKNITLNCRL